ncbi:hypothetical protein O6H91_13G043200 [Diphasiastrum complanatum]|uniref:Uncharacterized protein n=2 Tax=Diphasiastrum complanatum TaxID=34168 RepID=A0ACC2BU63_DIPCM|nr:hypothetical protein O6H91_13G043200 [Diphasiastrum complanatum]KAJ7533323.1 hypothetical protein O6H91_13G043200 [Diphasiastrum complanatum]
MAAPSSTSPHPAVHPLRCCTSVSEQLGNISQGWQKQQFDDSAPPLVCKPHQNKSILESDEEGRNSKRQHVQDLSLIEKLEEFWFWGNIVKSPSCASSLLLSPRKKLCRLPSFKRVEMLCPVSDPLETKEASTENAGDSLKMQQGEVRSLHSKTKRDFLDEDPLPRLKDNRVVEASETGFHAADLEGTKMLDNCKDEHESAFPIVPKNGKVAINKEVTRLEVTNEKKSQAARRRRRKEQRKGRKYFINLERDEMKGFTELGFSFSHDKLTPRLVSLFPIMKFEYDHAKNHSGAATETSTGTRHDDRQGPPLLYCPNLHQEGIDMKTQLRELKFWARAVACTVRQECCFDKLVCGRIT